MRITLATDFKTLLRVKLCVLASGSSVCSKNGSGIRHVYALCWLPPNRLLDVSTGIPLNFLIWYDQVPRKVL